MQIAGGAVVMLLIAALIEAFWSPAAIPVLLKYIVGAMLWGLVALLSHPGRQGSHLRFGNPHGTSRGMTKEPRTKSADL